MPNNTAGSLHPAQLSSTKEIDDGSELYKKFRNRKDGCRRVAQYFKARFMSEAKPGLRFGRLGEGAVHLCVDMQKMFDAGTPWATGWLRQVLPQVVRLCEAQPHRTIFTRFIPAQGSNDAPGAWRRYYRQYEEMTLERIDRTLLELVPELGLFVPPAQIADKRTYSPWVGTDLLRKLLSRNVDTIVMSGGETDVCVLATVLERKATGGRR